MPRISSQAGTMSFCWPGPRTKRIGKPSASTTAWTFVPSPPRERPRAWLERPLFYPCPRSLGLGADHGGVNRQPLDIGVIRDGLEDAINHSLFDPTIVTSFGCLIWPEPLGQVTPATARPGQPQKSIQKQPSVTARTPLPLTTTRHKLAQPLPLIVSQDLTFHTGLQKPVLNQKFRSA
jgi:hypothetical protein